MGVVPDMISYSDILVINYYQGDLVFVGNRG